MWKRIVQICSKITGGKLNEALLSLVETSSPESRGSNSTTWWRPRRQIFSGTRRPALFCTSTTNKSLHKLVSSLCYQGTKCWAANLRILALNQRLCTLSLSFCRFWFVGFQRFLQYVKNSFLHQEHGSYSQEHLYVMVSGKLTDENEVRTKSIQSDLWRSEWTTIWRFCCPHNCCSLDIFSFSGHILWKPWKFVKKIPVYKGKELQPAAPLPPTFKVSSAPLLPRLWCALWTSAGYLQLPLHAYWVASL